MTIDPPALTPCQSRWRELRRLVALRRAMADAYPKHTGGKRPRPIADANGGPPYRDACEAARRLGVTTDTVRRALRGDGPLSKRLRYARRVA